MHTITFDRPNLAIQYVATGEVSTGNANVLLNSGAIGSCVVIIAYDTNKRIGGMAHVMLPGEPLHLNTRPSTKYASDAIEELLNRLYEKGTTKQDIQVCLLGGANVLMAENNNIGEDNIVSIEKLLSDMDIDVLARSLGGTKRRTAIFDIGSACVYYTIGDSPKSLLWKY